MNSILWIQEGISTFSSKNAETKTFWYLSLLFHASQWIVVLQETVHTDHVWSPADACHQGQRFRDWPQLRALRRGDLEQVQLQHLGCSHGLWRIGEQNLCIIYPNTTELNMRLGEQWSNFAVAPNACCASLPGISLNLQLSIVFHPGLEKIESSIWSSLTSVLTMQKLMAAKIIFFVFVIWVG